VNVIFEVRSPAREESNARKIKFEVQAKHFGRFLVKVSGF
jgi:hypothetical protein